MRMIMAAMMVATLAAPALAAEAPAATKTVRVRTADLDLTSLAGQHALSRRMETAMIRLCGTPVLFSQDELAELDACKAEATKAAAPQLQAARSRLAVTLASRP